MNKLYFSFIFSVILFSGFGQNNFAPADSATTWNGKLHITAPGMSASWVQTYTDSIYNDTTVNNQTYTKLFSNQVFGDDYYYCAFRSDAVEKAIYILPKDSTQEYLFFDFDQPINVDDSIDIPCYFDFYDFHIVRLKVTGIDSIYHNGYYKTYTLEHQQGFPDPPSNHAPVFINISERFITTDAFPFLGQSVFEHWYELKCHSENSQSVSIISPLCPYPFQDFSSVEETTSTSGKMVLLPNPATDFVNIKTDLKNINSLTIFNLQGQKVYESNHFKNGAAINVSELPKGIYIVNLQSEGKTHSQKLIRQ